MSENGGSCDVAFEPIVNEPNGPTGDATLEYKPRIIALN